MVGGSKAFLIKTGRRIPPFDDPVADVLVGRSTLGSLQREVLSALGLTLREVTSLAEIPEQDYPCLAIDDDVYFSASAIEEFMRLSSCMVKSTRCAISSKTIFSRALTPFQDRASGDLLRFPLHYLRAPSSCLQDVTIDILEELFPVKLPRHMTGSEQTALPAAVRPLVQIRIAADILFANIAHLNIRFAELVRSRVRRTLLALRARSLQPARLLSRMNKIGAGCDIHPTACLEGAEIGARVQIGAHAVVRMSSIGDDCQIGDGSVVKHSVIGNGSVLFDDLTVGFVVCYPETFLIHGPYHLSVFGRSSAMFATILDDFRIDGKPIQLMRDGALLPYPLPFMGCFVGHRTRVAGGSIISPGRSIPNDLLILPSPDAVLGRIPAGLPRGVPLFIQHGTLRENRAVGASQTSAAQLKATSP